MAGIDTGGGGISSSSSAATGPATGRINVGGKTFNFGGNPNSAGNSFLSVLSNPFVLVTGVAVAYFFFRGRK
jgi:hypothetical protein